MPSPRPDELQAEVAEAGRRNAAGAERDFLVASFASRGGSCTWYRAGLTAMR